MRHRVTVPHTKHSCVCPDDIVVDGIVGGCVVFTSVRQQTRLPGHSPYRGTIIPSPETETIPLGLHSQLCTQMQFGSIRGAVVGVKIGKVGRIGGYVTVCHGNGDVKGVVIFGG